jgi:hypothetical protein
LVAQPRSTGGINPLGRGGTGTEAGSSPANMEVCGIASDRVASPFPVGLPRQAMKPSGNARCGVSAVVATRSEGVLSAR